MLFIVQYNLERTLFVLAEVIQHLPTVLPTRPPTLQGLLTICIPQLSTMRPFTNPLLSNRPTYNMTMTTMTTMKLGLQTVSIAKVDPTSAPVDYTAKHYHTYRHAPFRKSHPVSPKSVLYATVLAVGLLIIPNRNKTTLRDSLPPDTPIIKNAQGIAKN